jgi:hypothetical protein
MFLFKLPVEFIPIGRRESFLLTGQYEMALGASAEAEHPDRGLLTKMRRRARGRELPPVGGFPPVRVT